jgi:hypothetical protein
VFVRNVFCWHVTIFIAPSQPTHAFRAGSISTSPSVQHSRSLNSFPFSAVISPKLLLLGSHQVNPPNSSRHHASHHQILLKLISPSTQFSLSSTFPISLRKHSRSDSTYSAEPHSHKIHVLSYTPIRNTSLNSREVHNRRPGLPTGAIVKWETSAGPCTKTARVYDGVLSDMWRGRISCKEGLRVGGSVGWSGQALSTWRGNTVMVSR